MSPQRDYSDELLVSMVLAHTFTGYNTPGRWKNHYINASKPVLPCAAKTTISKCIVLTLIEEWPENRFTAFPLVQLPGASSIKEMQYQYGEIHRLMGVRLARILSSFPAMDCNNKWYSEHSHI